jgi:penicillin-binding protein 2
MHKEAINIIRKKTTLKRKYHNPLIEPDQIFLDSKNLPEFDTQQFEGQIEKPISRGSMFGVGIFFCLVVILFAGRLWNLQVAHSSTYVKMSKNNSLNSEPIFSARGTIDDRNGVPLVWNDTQTIEYPWGKRTYIAEPGFSHILGYIGYPAKDKSGNYWQTEIIGRDGVEKKYDDLLSGTNGSTIVERDISGNVQGGNIVNPPVAGKNLTLTIDSRLQTKLNQFLAASTHSAGFRSASGIVMDIHTGEIIALTNVPEYDSNVMSSGDDRATIKGYLQNSNTPLMNRAVSGLFTPGSDVKPYVGLEALQEGVIDQWTTIESNNSISIPNPYFPDKPSVFRDYYANNGWVDMRHALEVSSNIYFMEIAGGYKSQKGIGIDNLQKAWLRFGITQKTGIDLPLENTGTIPGPDWKAKKFPGEAWRLGDTYNTSIGQYGVQVTPIQMARAVAGIATRGTLVVPHVLKDSPVVEKKITDIDDKNYTAVQEGMRLAAIHGTTPDVTPVPFTLATKSGTAQVGPGGKNVNSWMTGFFPYEHPNYAFVIMFENGPAPAIGTAHRVTRQFLGWVGENAPEYGQ